MENPTKKSHNAWCLYDWANSSYSLVITSAIFPAYFLSISINPNGSNKIPFLWWKAIDNSVLYAYLYSFSSFVIMLFNPFFSSIADYAGMKKKLMRLFSYIGAFSCILLFFSDSHALYLTSILFIVSSVCYSLGVVFYNSFLPDIATPDQYNALSAKGFAWGYVGGLIMLLICLVIIQYPQSFGFTPQSIKSNYPIKTSFALVGVWWLLFAHLAFLGLPNDKPLQVAQAQYWQGYKLIADAFKETIHRKLLSLFLLGFFFYNMGVQTVMGLATVFAKVEVGLATPQLIITILILQMLAIVGSYLFVWLATKTGNIQTLIFGVFWWIGIGIYAFFVRTPTQFYILSILVGLIMGGIQSLSRATMAKLIANEKDKQTLFFGFYDILDKVGAVLGTFLYGLAESLTGNMRTSILILTAFFFIALIYLFILNPLKLAIKQV